MLIKTRTNPSDLDVAEHATIAMIKLFNLIRQERGLEQPTISFTISGDELKVKAVYQCTCGCTDEEIVEKTESVQGLMKLYPDFFDGGKHAV
jgi:hypothetical protein